MFDAVYEELVSACMTDPELYRKLMDDMKRLVRFDEDGIVAKLAGKSDVPALAKFKHDFNELADVACALGKALGGKDQAALSVSWFNTHFRRINVYEFIDVPHLYDLCPQMGQAVITKNLYLYKDPVETAPFITNVIDKSEVMEDLWRAPHYLRFFMYKYESVTDYYLGSDDISEYESWVLALYKKVYRLPD